jgi:hypothetical protein
MKSPGCSWGALGRAGTARRLLLSRRCVARVREATVGTLGVSVAGAFLHTRMSRHGRQSARPGERRLKPKTKGTPYHPASALACIARVRFISRVRNAEGGSCDGGEDEYVSAESSMSIPPRGRGVTILHPPSSHHRRSLGRWRVVQAKTTQNALVSPSAGLLANAPRANVPVPCHPPTHVGQQWGRAGGAGG